MVVFWLAPAAGFAGDGEETMEEYLGRKGLSAAECLERSPGDLMGWVKEREHLQAGSLTTGGEQAVIDHFYGLYRVALRPAIDARYPQAKALREPLQDLHWFIYAFMLEASGDRNYVTPKRMAAFTEHALKKLCMGGGSMHVRPAAIHPTRAEVATFARLKAGIWHDNMRGELDYDRFAATLLRKLKAVEEAAPKKAGAFDLRIHVVEFLDQPVEEMNPSWVF